MSICGKNACKKCEYKDRCANSDERPQTNEEWLRQCDTEQLAECLADVCYELLDDVWSNDGDTSCNYSQTYKNYWLEWLKEKYE